MLTWDTLHANSSTPLYAGASWELGWMRNVFTVAEFQDYSGVHKIILIFLHTFLCLMDLWARVKLILCDSFRKKDISEKCQYYFVSYILKRYLKRILLFLTVLQWGRLRFTILIAKLKKKYFKNLIGRLQFEKSDFAEYVKTLSNSKK